MKVIAHRANVNGPCEKSENSLQAIEEALNLGFDIELDVWSIGGKLHLSHWYPDVSGQSVPEHLLRDNRVWWHAKNLEALRDLLGISAHVFWHEADDYTLTNRGFIWTHPGRRLTKSSIVVLPEKSLQKIPLWVAGVCTDFPQKYKDRIAQEIAS